MVEVKVLSGLRSIGGNFIRIEDKDRILVFDQGIRFDIMDKYYTSFITPRSVAELRELGVLPKSEWYENVDTIYISHMHLDHLGALSNIPSEMKILLPSLSIYNEMEERWSTSPTWLSLIPRRYYVEVEELKPLETDENDVLPVPVSHSAYPAYSFLYFGRDETLLYTGDFRIESFLTEDEFYDLNRGKSLLEFLEEKKDLRIDTLIIEGTNMGSSRLPISPEETMKIIRKLAQSHKQIIATLHGLDLEYAYALTKLSEELKLKFYVASSQIANLLQKIPNLPLKPKVVADQVGELTAFEKIALEEVEEKSLILVSYREAVDLVKDLALANRLSKDSVFIVSEPEPQVEEASEYEVIANWFLRMGVEFYRIRVSGHYYPYQLKAILKAAKPRKRIQVVHTENPGLFNLLIRGELKKY
jgi:ribonuclease J